MKLIKQIKGAKMLVEKAREKYNNDAEFRKMMDYQSAYTVNSVDKHKILYETMHGSSMTGNPFAIFLEIINDSSYDDFEHIWVVRKLETFDKKGFDNNPKVRFVVVHSKEYMDAITSAKYLINNTTFPPYFQKKDHQIYVNTWHGTPLKTLGKDMKGIVSQHKNIQRNLIQSDYIVSPNKYTSDVLIDSHDLRGIYPGEIIEEGYPRVDLTYKINSKDDYLESINKHIEIDKEKKIVLYAPTWRGEVGKVTDIVEQVKNNIIAMSKILPDEYQLILKVHNQVYTKMKTSSAGLEKFFVSNDVDTNELLAVVDVLITDYSSIFFDYLITKKPFILYTYDLEEYEEHRGLYMNLEEFGAPVCNTIQEIEEIFTTSNWEKYINKAKYEESIKKYCQYNEQKNVTSKYIDIIFKNKKEGYNLYNVRNNKRNIFVYGGGFLNNGITTSLINLSYKIDYSKYNFIVIEGETPKPENEKNLKRMSSQTKIFYRVGITNVNAQEWAMYSYSLKKYDVMAEKIGNIKKIYRREWRRLFGNIKLDIVIDFSGYVPFWNNLLGYSNAQKKIVFQHNDMLLEYEKIIDGKYKHRQLNVVFNMYRHFDVIACVGEQTMQENINNLKEFAGEDKYIYIPNYIHIEDVQKKSEDFRDVIDIEDEKYLLLEGNLRDAVLSFVKIPNKNELTFINVGRHSPEKGQDKLLIAFQKFLSKYPKSVTKSIKLYLLGTGVLTAQLELYVKENGLDDNVVFSGHVDNPFLIMKSADCYVSSSNHEGQPMVLLEALTLGLDIIATDIEGNVSVIGHEYGNIVDNSIDGLVMGFENYILWQEDINKYYKKFDAIAYEADVTKRFTSLIE